MSILSHSSLVFIIFLIIIFPVASQSTAIAQSKPVTEQTAADSLEEQNKAIARAFYEDLWFSNNTDQYDKYVAEEYVVHDIGDRKDVLEPAVEQKRIADFLHSQGEMTGSIDYQIAEGDLVATRWQWQMEPTSVLFRIMGGSKQIPIINVMRFQDGKIVEIWNHRHDIDAFQGNIPFVKGLGIGLFIALFGWGIAFFQWRKWKAAYQAR